MSASPQLRRTDKQMSDPEMDTLLSAGFCGHLSSVGADGWPYVCPLLYVWRNHEVWLHNTSATGHLRSNVGRDSRAVGRMTGKKTPLPAERARWPAVDNTKSPHVKAPL